MTDQLKTTRMVIDKHIVSKKICLFIRQFSSQQSGSFLKYTGIFTLIVSFLLISLFNNNLIAQTSGVDGRISGSITDAATGEALPGANVLIQGTSLGAAADMEGHYIIAKVPPGSYTLVVTYIGFKAKEFPVRVTP
ncbi:carboxypeptidase-like regulatory domain-containing protein, partial [candidate division KSB1 bacterium]|nr:carboxypeptidase-like regulatory domain-containing protein [candidate division KSB1 bacterium]